MSKTLVPIVGLVMVYGTLKRECWNHTYLEGAPFLASVQTADASWKLCYPGQSYPYLLPTEPGQGMHVKGELFAIGQDHLAGMDRLEGCPHHYQRVTIAVTDRSGRDLNLPRELPIYVYTPNTESDRNAYRRYDGMTQSDIWDPKGVDVPEINGRNLRELRAGTLRAFKGERNARW